MAKAVRWLITILVIAGAAVWALVQLLRGHQDASSTSSIVGLVLTALSLALSLGGWEAGRKALPQRDDGLTHAQSAARTLARRVLAAEEKQFRALIGRDEEQLTLTFTRRAPDTNFARGEERGQVAGSSPSADAGIPDITEYYRACEKPRLVVTGAAGAGKTVLSVQLVRGLLGQRTSSDPVPVRVPLAEWDLKMPFEKLLIGYVIKAGISEQRAEWIVENGLVLPVLDGLDEMDPGLTDTHGDIVYGLDGEQLPDPRAPRALEALKRLNDHGNMVSTFPLVLLCRKAHYDALPRSDRLQHAVGVDIDPLSLEHVAAHLTRVFEDEERWQRFAQHLSSSAVLYETLATPWWLFLVKAVYHRRGDPSELFSYSSARPLKDHLLSLFIPAVVDIRPSRYDAERVRGWLAVIARHLRSGPDAGERVDIHRPRLWPIAGIDRVRYTDAVAAALVFLGLVLPLLLLRESTAAWLYPTAGLGAVLAARDVFRQAGDLPMCVPWGRMFSEATLRLAIDTVPVGLVLGGLGGLAALPVAWLADALGLRSLVSFLPALAVFWSVLLGMRIVHGTGLTHTFGGTYPPDVNTAVRWHYVLRGDLLFGGAVFVVAGLSMAAARWVMSFSDVLVLSSVPILDVLTFGLMAAALRWVQDFGGGRRYLVFLLCVRHQLPYRLGGFLRWSHAGGLLRTSGGAYQFRHREFQRWLAQNP
ncbi:NACHT domain-containing protein [Streptomyces sp. NPDC059010]|uniref:NACHT domain-containing protein n=1 Tax=Streptomyces sp. NPDC059010 TaxID=3346695 RepID=UPI003684DEE5